MEHVIPAEQEFDQELVDNLKAKLAQGPVRFAFIKRDGTLREAYGTRNMSLVPEEHRPKGTDKRTPGTIPFWDLEAEAWKSLREDSLVWIEE